MRYLRGREGSIFGPFVAENEKWRRVTRAPSLFFQAEDGIRDVERSRGLGDVYKRQEWCSEHHALFTFSLPAPIRELRGRPLKFSFYNISKTVKNLWSLVEQKMLEMTRPFDRYQEIRAGPLNKGPRRGWHFWHISFELFICWHRS